MPGSAVAPIAAAEIELSEDQLNLSTRFPHDERGYVAEILADLHEAGVLDSVEYPNDEFEDLRRMVAECFVHDCRTTYIFPEEARLLFAVAHLIRPRNTVSSARTWWTSTLRSWTSPSAT